MPRTREGAVPWIAPRARRLCNAPHAAGVQPWTPPEPPPHSAPVMRIVSLLAFALLAWLPAALAAQAHPETVRGRVVGDSGKAVPQASVIVTRAPDRETRTTQTDTAGNFSITFPEGTGDYLVHVNALGWSPFRRRVTRTGTEDVLAVDVKLTPRPVELAGVTISGRRERPTRNTPLSTETGASEQVFDGVNGALSPEQMGDLAAMAATLPGAVAGPGGVSVLGLDPGQNNTTLNGMSFSGADIPRDARTWTRFASSTYDPARGGFSGAQTSVDLSPGNTFSFRRSHLTLDAPRLQYTDPVSEQLGGQFTNLQLSVGGDGMLVPNKYFYNVAAQGSRRTTRTLSLADASAEVLRLSGVSPDSAGRLLGLLSTAGIPVRTDAVPRSRTTDNVSLIGRIDRTPFGNRAWGVVGYAKLSRAEGGSSAATATPAHGGSTTSGMASLQGNYSFYHRKNTLNETRSAFSYNVDRADPYLLLPEGRVSVSSSFGDGTGGISSLAFGGNAAMQSDRRSWTWETTNTTQWYDLGNQHRVKVYGQSRLDGYTLSRAGNRFGTFSYASLADLAANRPASFSRTLSSPSASGGEWSGAFAVGDLWKKTPTLQILYGARLEGNVFTSAPPFNPAVEQAFGARTDHAPNTVHVSPRLGFTWVYSGARNQGGGYSVGPLGTRVIGPKGYLRGGIGEFRGLLSPSLLAPAQLNTGLAGGTRRIQCIGAAVPTPEWGAYLADPDAVPENCVGGAVSPVFSDVAPAVQLFGQGYTAPRSWRANLAWSSQWKKLGWAVEGIYSLNRSQPGVFDLNFADQPKFTLPAEGGRPVYVSPGSIVPGTGTLSPVEARRTGTFGHVMENRSDLRSDSRQLTVRATPDLPFGRYMLSLAYTLSDSREQRRGFDGATFGSPRAAEWAPSAQDARHQFLLQAGWSHRYLNVSLMARLSSGTPFTPLVGGDVNGDGLFNDRAFVFDPGAVRDPALAAGMRSLLDDAPGWARECLERQVGEAAERGGCRGPWTQSLNVRVGLSNALLRAGRRLNVALNLSNPLGGIDQLFNGGGQLRGWGTPALPDPVLYRVRGFDPAAREFRYEVNPRFGDTRPTRTAVRAPFRLTLDVSLDWGKSLPLQQVERWLRPGRAGHPGTRLSADSLKKLYARNVPDLYRGILQESDSLMLTREQVDTLRAAQKRYLARMDSVWTVLAQHMAGLPDRFDTPAELKYQEDTIDRAWGLSRDEARTLKNVLSPLQMKMLPWPASMLADMKPEEKVQVRVFMSG